MVTITIVSTQSRNLGEVIETITAEWAHVRDGCLVYQIEAGSGRVMHRAIPFLGGDFEIYDPMAIADPVKAGHALNLQQTHGMGVPPVHGGQTE